MKFAFEPLTIPGVILIKPEVTPDDRGFFMETYKYSVFKDNGIAERFVQENLSFSKKNVLRGLHYQSAPHAQGKLVQCLRGEIFDVAVDIRKDSATCGKWVSAILTGENRRQLYIPEGFAHGFCVLSDTAEVSYKCTAEYAPSAEKGILWNDPAIDIKWPISDPILSEKDAKNLSLAEALHGERI